MLELFLQCGICFSFYFHDFSVDGILVWDVHKIMASSNRLMEFWLGYAQNYGELKRSMEFQPSSANNGISNGNTDIHKR